MYKNMTELQSFGYDAEQAFERAAVSRGYQVHPYSVNFQSQFDLLGDGLLPIEVKGARPKLYRNGKGQLSWRWQFNIASLGSNPGREDFILVLACWVPSRQDFEYFLIPSAFLAGRGVWLSITSLPAVYRGWMSRCYQDWQVLDFLSARLRLSVNGSFWGLK